MIKKGAAMYSEKNIIAIAKRENNNKRKFLVVNRLQGKHIPVSPSCAIDMFANLAQKVSKRYENEKLLVIGFAETATAISSHVASLTDSYYIQTTREVIEGASYIFFSEEHSHASEQKLVKNELDNIITMVDRVVFVEDEVTTGKTIMNIVNILKELYPQMARYAVASIINSMDENSIKSYNDADIDIIYMLKTDNTGYDSLAQRYFDDLDNYRDETFFDCSMYKKDVMRFLAGDYINPRKLCNGKEYAHTCERLAKKICKKLDIKNNEKILVIGTEECMYPAIIVGTLLERDGIEVKTHSTTRSPIMVNKNDDYPFHNRYKILSVYDKDRTTYIYDVDQYDMVVVVTDSPNIYKESENTLLNALSIKGNKKICIVKWTGMEDENEEQL